VIQQLHALLLPINDDLVEMWGANLLRLDDQVVLGLVCEVDLDLVKVDLLCQVGIHLCDMLRIQVFNATNVHIGDVEDIAADVI
jgi:hypothetical protein